MDAQKFIRNEPAAKQMRDLGFRVSELAAGGVHIEGNVSDLSRFIEWIEADREEAKHLKALRIPSAKRAVELMFDADTHFIGGSYDSFKRSLRGDLNMEPFHKAKDDLRKTGFAERLRDKIEYLVPKRARVTSEHDGDWSFDRRWEISPFESTSRRTGAGRTVKLTANLCVSCGVSAEKINKFATLVWAVSEVLEDCGIQTEVITRYFTRNVTSTLINGKYGSEVLEIQAKSADQYIHPTILAALCKSQVYRRAMFAMSCVSAGIQGSAVASGLGRPDNGGFPVKWVNADGRLYMNAETLTGSTEQLEAEILASVEATISGTVGAA